MSVLRSKADFVHSSADVALSPEADMPMPVNIRHIGEVLLVRSGAALATDAFGGIADHRFARED